MKNLLLQRKMHLISTTNSRQLYNLQLDFKQIELPRLLFIQLVELEERFKIMHVAHACSGQMGTGRIHLAVITSCGETIIYQCQNQEGYKWRR